MLFTFSSIHLASASHLSSQHTSLSRLWVETQDPQSVWFSALLHPRLWLETQDPRHTHKPNTGCRAHAHVLKIDFYLWTTHIILRSKYHLHFCIVISVGATYMYQGQIWFRPIKFVFLYYSGM